MKIKYLLIHAKGLEQDQTEESQQMLYYFTITIIIISDNRQTCSYSCRAHILLLETDKQIYQWE